MGTLTGINASSASSTFDFIADREYRTERARRIPGRAQETDESEVITGHDNDSFEPGVMVADAEPETASFRAQLPPSSRVQLSPSLRGRQAEAILRSWLRSWRLLRCALVPFGYLGPLGPQ